MRISDWSSDVCSSDLLFWVTSNTILAAGFVAGLAVAAAGVLLVRRLSPAAVSGEAAAPDWTMLRHAVNHDDAAIAVTDRAARMACGNDLSWTWTSGFVTPPGLPPEGRGAGDLKHAGPLAWPGGAWPAAAN